MSKGFDTSWFLSKEYVDLYVKTRNESPEEAYELYLIIDNTQELWEASNRLIISAIKHENFDPEICATSALMNKIIRAGVKEYNKYNEPKLGNLSKDFKKLVGMMIVTNWEA